MANDVKIVLTAQDKASEGVNRVTGRIEALEKASSDVAARMDTIRNALASVVTIGSGAVLAKQFIDVADSMSLLQSRVKLATSGTAEFLQVQTDLFALAQRNSVSLEEVAGAFSRLSDPVKRLGGGATESIGIIDALSKSLKISGASSQEAAAAIQQFGQAMGSGKLQGDEFKSLAEAAPRFMKAISEGSGIAAEKLKEMSSEGKLTADVVGNALLKSLGKLNAEAAQMPDTVGQAMTRLKNEVAKAVDEINQAGGINGGLAGLIGDAGQLIGPIKQEMIEAFQAVSLWVENNREGLTETGRVVGGLVSDVWHMAEAMASVAGFAADASAKSGGLKTVLESVRIILAGIEDGIAIIGAAFVKVGADITDVLYKPLGNLMLAYGNALDMLGSSSAGWWQETGDRIRNTTNAAHEYADGVHAAFANNESALGRLNTQLANTAAAQSEAGSAAAVAGVALAEQGKTAAKTAAAFASLRSSLKGDADKGKSGTDPYQSLLENLRRQLATTEKLSAVEKLNRDLQDKQYAKIGTLKKAELQAVAAQIDAQQRLAAVRKLDEADEAARVAWTTRHGQALAEEEQAIWDKVEAEVEAAAAIGKSRTEIEARTLALMEEQLAWREALDLQDEETAQLKRKIAAQKAMIAAVRNTESTQAAADAGKAAIDAAKKAAEAAAAEWQKTVDTIDGTFHDAFTDMLKQGEADWESFTDSLATTFKSAVADEIYKMTLKPLVLNVVGSFSGSGAPAVPGADGQPLSISNGFGVVSGVQTAWAGMSGGITNAANSFALSGMGQAAGLSTSGAVMGPPTAAGTMGWTDGALTGAGGTFAAAAAPVLGALTAAYAIAEMQKSGWGIDNDAKSGALAAVSVGTLGANVILDRLFGHNRNVSNDAQGITGTFDASGFAGQSFQEKSQKGGAFRSDKRWTDYGAIGADMDKALDSMLKQAVSGVQAIGKTLGVEAGNAMEGFSHTFALQLSENGDMSKAGEKIAAEIKKVQDELVTKLVPNIEDFARYGESAADTFGRLNQEVTATDAILLAMGKNAGEAFGAVGLASIKAREDLIDLAGGLDKLASKTQAFYQAYYSSSEQQQLAAKQAQQVLVTGFADIGQSIPASRAAFRGLVEAQDLSTEAGRKLWNSLLDLSDEFDTVQKLADAAAESTKAATQSQASLFDSFASDAQKLDAARKLVGDTFASIGKDVPASSAAFLQLTQAIDPATEAGQQMIAALQKVGGAFAYVQTTAAAAAKATLTGQASKIEGDMQSLVARFGSLSPVARTVADDLAATQQQLAGLSDGLANLFGGKQLTDLEKLGQTVNYRTQIRGAISQLNDDIFEAALKGMSRPQQIEQLKKAEADLWAGMASAADKGQQASQIRSVVLRRLGLESDEANGAASKVADLAKQARQDQIETLRTQIDGMQRLRDLAGQIADFTANLSIGDLSPLSYADQLSAAQAQFEQTLGKAKGGDQQAQGQLTNNAKTYLDEARSYFASSTDYAAIYEKVTGSLKSIASPADSTLTAAQAQLDTLSKLPDVMAAMVDTSKDDVAALQAVQAALRSGDDYLTKSIDAQTVALQKQIDTLTTIASNQDAQIKQAGAAYQQMTDELKAVKAQLAAIEANGALAGAA